MNNNWKQISTESRQLFLMNEDISCQKIAVCFHFVEIIKQDWQEFSISIMTVISKMKKNNG